MAIPIGTKQVSAGATRLVEIDCTEDCGAASLTGTPTVTGPAALTLANKKVSTEARTIDGRTVAIGKAIQFTVVGQADGTSYLVTISCATDGTPAETLVYELGLEGV